MAWGVLRGWVWGRAAGGGARGEPERCALGRRFDGAAAHCRARFLIRLITFEIFFVCVVFLPLGLFVYIKIVFSGPTALFDMNGDGDLQDDEDPTWAVGLLMSTFGLVHIGVTIGLCVLFAGLLLVLCGGVRSD